MALVGKKAPDFTADAVVEKEIKKVSLSDYTYKKWVVLLFYPFDFTQVTTSEIISFSDAYEDFTNHN
ncbi:MAG: redoxin domain-containing protein, partial [Deferribacterota bacterium]|nr:redoxin domain-containing protein [Deferribacterota bacterium]